MQKDYGLDPDVLNWISWVVKTQPGTDPEKMAEELEQRGFAFTSSAQEASLTHTAPIIKMIFKASQNRAFYHSWALVDEPKKLFKNKA